MSPAVPHPLFPTDRSGLLARDLLCSELHRERIVPQSQGCLLVSPRGQRISVGVTELLELAVFFQVRSCDFPDLDVCLLSFRAHYAGLSCENTCSQRCWRCLAICHEMKLLSLLEVKHQIDSDFLLRDGSYFHNNIRPFSLYWIVNFTKRYWRSCYWKK